MYGQNFIGVIQANMLGTRFDVFDYGLKPNDMKDLPKGFMPKQRLI